VNRWFVSVVDVATDLTLGVLERLVVVTGAVGSLIEEWRDGR